MTYLRPNRAPVGRGGGLVRDLAREGKPPQYQLIDPANDSAGMWAVGQLGDQAVDTADAAAALAEFDDACKRAENLWGVRLCGHLVLVHPETRVAVANRPDRTGAFRAYQQGLPTPWLYYQGLHLWQLLDPRFPKDRHSRFQDALPDTCRLSLRGGVRSRVYVVASRGWHALAEYTRDAGTERERQRAMAAIRADSRRWSLTALPQDFADMPGGEEKVERVADVYHALPPHDRADGVIITSHYGQAGAIDFCGPHLGLPRAHTPVGSFWFWGPGDKPGPVIIKVGGSDADLQGYCNTIALAVRIDEPWVCPRSGTCDLGLPRPARDNSGGLPAVQRAELESAVVQRPRDASPPRRF